MAEPLECIILDFDGTFTDVEREAIPFLETYRAGLAALVDAPSDEAWERAVARVRADPDRHGFDFEGRIVAPSHADPYILATSVASLVLDELGGPEGEARGDALEALFKQAYGESDTVFRDDAREVAEALLEHGAPVFVVSNSHTAHVEAKIARLAPRGAERLTVRGDARKFHLVDPAAHDPRFDAVDEAMTLEGLGRPVYLRRGLYFDALREIWEATGASPETTLVAGDIFELDLALPAALGASIHHVARPRTPDYEREAVESLGGRSTVELRGVLERLE
ncbi:MAG TPA: hypothetical protein RMH99_20690 [Sandaracinaceae bacterium LLY-WYZ-13_1]|nr:hypothetical protein [Sandaracinaceae bacterium LLY-WYZ-13_1]